MRARDKRFTLQTAHPLNNHDYEKDQRNESNEDQAKYHTRLHESVEPPEWPRHAVQHATPEHFVRAAWQTVLTETRGVSTQ